MNSNTARQEEQEMNNEMANSTTDICEFSFAIESAYALLQEGDVAQAKQMVNEWQKSQRDSLYQEIGNLTRGLHDSIRNFSLNWANTETQECNKSILDKESNAKNHIDYVIGITEHAANETLDKVSKGIDLLKTLEPEAKALESDLSGGTLENKHQDTTARLSSFILAFNDASAEMRDHLTQILMAQEFQDLSAQALEQLSSITNKLEDDLVSLVKTAANVDEMTGKTHTFDDIQVDPLTACGPAVAPEENTVSGQDEVDDLLKQLGF